MSDDPTQGGPSGTPTDPASGGGNNKNGFVSVETYKKTVAAEKNSKAREAELAAKVAEYEAEKEASREAQLLAEKKHMTVIEEQKLKIQELSGHVQKREKDITDFQKMTAIMGAMTEKGINLESKYMGLVPIDQVKISDDGQVDTQSVFDVVNNFQRDNPRLVLPFDKMLPNEKSGSVKQMSTDEWKKLGSKAEREAALKEGRVKHDYKF